MHVFAKSIHFFFSSSSATHLFSPLLALTTHRVELSQKHIYFNLLFIKQNPDAPYRLTSKVAAITRKKIQRYLPPIIILD